MLKSLAFVALGALFATMASGSQLSPEERATCIRDSAAYLSKGSIDSTIAKLVEASRSFYADILDMIEDDVPSIEYREKLLDMGPEPGCERLEDHVQNLEEAVDCFKELDEEEEGLPDIVRANEGAKQVIEAYFACVFSSHE